MSFQTHKTFVHLQNTNFWPFWPYTESKGTITFKARNVVRTLLKQSVWHQWFNRNFMKLRKFLLCTKKTKITTLFNNSSLAWSENSFRKNVIKKNLNLCFEDERRSYGFGTTWRWVNDRIFIFGWTIPLNMTCLDNWQVQQVQGQNRKGKRAKEKTGISKSLV